MENLEVMAQENPLQDVLFVVLLNRNESFGVRAPYDLEIMGKKMWEWVAMSGNGAKIKTTPCTENSDIINLVKPFVGKETYTMVFYSDTPLITKQNVLEILDYFQRSGLNVLKLKRGFVFNSQYLLNCENILASANPIFDEEEFDAVDGYVKLGEVTDKIRKRILDFHKQNGVYIIDDASTYIDADTIIEKGVKIEQNNVIKGETYIGENTILEPNNTIISSIVSKNVIVKNSYISNSRIGENMIVGPFEAVIDKNV